MTHVLDGCFAKLDRAAEHIDALRTETDPLAADKSVTFETDIEFHIEPSGEHWTIFRCSSGPAIPLRWGVLIGDAIHDLRSPLDHLAWQLALHNRRGKLPSRSTKFPICRTLGEWAGDSTKKALAQVHASHRAIIERHQPYKRGDKADAHPLGTLNALSNTDKHQIIVPVVSAIADVPTRVVQEVGGIIDSIQVNVGVPLEPGAELFRFRTIQEAPKAEMGVEFKFDVYVAFEDRSRVGDALEMIHIYVMKVLEDFRKLL